MPLIPAFFSALPLLFASCCWKMFCAAWLKKVVIFGRARALPPWISSKDLCERNCFQLNASAISELSKFHFNVSKLNRQAEIRASPRPLARVLLDQNALLTTSTSHFLIFFWWLSMFTAQSRYDLQFPVRNHPALINQWGKKKRYFSQSSRWYQLYYSNLKASLSRWAPKIYRDGETAACGYKQYAQK